MSLSRSPRVVRAVVVSACFAVAGLVAATPSSAATYSCTPPAYPDTRHGGYFAGPNGAKKFRVSGYSKSRACRSGRSLILAYHNCRRERGIKGSCSGRTINGLKCTERRDPDLQIRSELNASVSCRKGTKRISYIYQQNLGG